MSYTRDTSADLVYNSSTGEYEAASTPATSGYLTDGNGNILLFNGQAVYVDEEPTPIEFSDELKNYAVTSSGDKIFLGIAKNSKVGSSNLSNTLVIKPTANVVSANSFYKDNVITIYTEQLSQYETLTCYCYGLIANTSAYSTSNSDLTYFGIYDYRTPKSGYITGSFIPVMQLDDFSNITKVYIGIQEIGLNGSESKNIFNLTNNETPIEIDLTGLKKSSFIYAFKGMNISSINFSTLEGFKTYTAARPAMMSAFENATISSISFPALKSTGFNSNRDAFGSSMLSGVTGCTVHFPSNLQTLISGFASYSSGFGGTNTTILFDLDETS